MTEQIKRFHPIGRLRHERDCTGGTVPRKQRDASFMTGAALSVDGGMAAAWIRLARV